MAPHLSLEELDKVQKLTHQGLAPQDIQANLAKSRGKQGIAAPTVNNVRRAMQGKTYKRGAVETRGRKKLMTPKRVRAVDVARKELQKEHKNSREVTMPMILRRARVKVDCTTASRALKEQGVQWRSSREKATRTPEQELARKEWCAKKRRLPANYFSTTIDLIIDCKKFELPLNVRARVQASSRKVRGTYRSRSEGLKAELLK